MLEGLPNHLSNNAFIRDIFSDVIHSSSSVAHSMADRSAMGLTSEMGKKKGKYAERERGRDAKLAHLISGGEY